MHALPSLQLAAAPGTHEPPLHVSFAVQAYPSLQGLVLFANPHPLDGLHESVVHPFPSLHTSAVPD